MCDEYGLLDWSDGSRRCVGLINPHDDTPWREVGQHQFDTTDELDVTLTTTLRPDETSAPRLRGIDPEEAERLLRSAREAGVDLEVRFCVDGRPVKIDTKGVVSVKDDC